MSYEDGMPAGGNSRFRGYPARMSERQQLALLLQMTSQDIGGNPERAATPTNTSRSSSLQHQKNSKSKWTHKNGESPVQTSLNRREDFRVRQMLANGYDLTSNEGSDITDINSPEDITTTNRINSPVESVVSTPPNEHQDQQYQQHHTTTSQYQHQRTAETGSALVTTPHVVVEDGTAPCEMRRTPPQNKDRSGTGAAGSSPRVTLRLNQVRGSRDEKKGNALNSSRQGSMSSQGQGQMESSSKSSGTGNVGQNTSSSGNPSSTESTDVYEFKSSKEATPVRGDSSSPNLISDKDKESAKNSNNQAGNVIGNVNSASAGSGSSPIGSGNINSNNNNNAINPNEGSVDTGANNHSITGVVSGGNNSIVNPSSSTSPGDTTGTAFVGEDSPTILASPTSKRPYEGDVGDEQDEENRRKKRKDSDSTKDNIKNTSIGGRQSTGRIAAGVGEKGTKPGKQNSGIGSSKGNQNATSSISSDRKSPNTASMASSPKPSNSSGSTSNLKTISGTGTTLTTTINPESDDEDDRSKSSDSNSAPKVPPLKIVIPQSTTLEQEQGNRNGKNTSNRTQLPYVVASSNSNDSTDKDQSQSASGTTSPTDNTITVKTEDKKDFSGSLHGEERSTHHQRVLRSSHRSGNGGNGSSSKESSSNVNNGNCTNSSPLPTVSTERSNNSSPQQRNHSPTPETNSTETNKSSSAESSNVGTNFKSNTEKSEKSMDSGGKNPKDGNTENTEPSATSTFSTSSNVNNPTAPVELHPRKRKMKPNKEAQQAAATAAANDAVENINTGPEVHPHDQPITNCYQLFLNIRKQIERRRKGLFPVQPKPPQGFKDYLMNRCTYVLAGTANKEPNINSPTALQGSMKDLYIEQEKERYRLRMQHVVEKEKLVLSVEQEILRVHGRAARALANQSLPFSVCTILKDEEVYNVITPEQEEKDRNARSRYNGRLFLSWLQDVDDKWEKIKEAMLLRHHNEAESLHAVQRMDWEWKLKEVGICEFKATPQIEDIHVPMVHVSDDFDLLPA